MNIETPLTDEQLKSISSLAETQVSLEQAKVELETKLDALGEELRRVREELLPEAMMQIGLDSFVLKSGHAIRIDKFYAGKIPDDRAPEAFDWLRKNDLESIIKREIKAIFGKNEDKKAEQVFQALIDMGANPVDKAGVHPQTLKSFIRERMENGLELPQELFGVFVGNRAKVTPPKQ